MVSRKGSNPRPRREYGSGAVYRDKSTGLWRGVVRLPNGKRRSVSAPTQREAKEKLDALRREVADDDEAPTVGAWLAVWLDELAETATENNYANRQWSIDRLAPLHGMRMDEVRADDVEQVLADAGLSRSSLVRLRSVLAMAYDAWNGRQGRTFNPARLAKRLPKTAARTAERRSLTHDEAERVLEAAATDREGIVVVLGYYLGLRPGEVTGLRWSDVDLDAGTVTVAQMRRRNPDGSLSFCGPKADSGRTLTNAPAEVMAALREHRTASGRIGGLVVASRTGAPMDPSNHRRALTRIARAAGIFDGLTPNELRHTYATHRMAASNGRDVEKVARSMGHKDERMVRGTYDHSRRVIDMGA